MKTNSAIYPTTRDIFKAYQTTLQRAQKNDQNSWDANKEAGKVELNHEGFVGQDGAWLIGKDEVDITHSSGTRYEIYPRGGPISDSFKMDFEQADLKDYAPSQESRPAVKISYEAKHNHKLTEKAFFLADPITGTVLYAIKLPEIGANQPA